MTEDKPSLEPGEVRFALYLDDKKYGLHSEGLHQTAYEADYIVALFKNALYQHWGLNDKQKDYPGWRASVARKGAGPGGAVEYEMLRGKA